MMMLFLDDERFPAFTCEAEDWIAIPVAHGSNHTVLVEGFNYSPNEGWRVARTVEAAIAWIEAVGQCPGYVMFDHDLQTEATGMTLAKWLVERDMDAQGKFFPVDFTYYVHSQNVNGAANIQNYLDGYFKQRNNG